MSIDPSAWQLLNTTYASLGIVPVIGAGASAASGLPNWETLLLRIGRRLLPDTGERLIKELRKEGFSLPAVAGMLRPFCGESDFAEIVREALYRDLPLAMRETDGLCDGFVDHMRANTTLRALGAICAVEASGQPQFECNPRIHAVVTFNLDPLLRRYVQARYDRRLLRTVERPSKERNPGKINIYYMHGFLRFDAKAGERNAEASDKLVLAEQEYFDFFNNPTGLFNYTFLHLLREHSCLFVGLSMQDDNIRRLLHYSCKERVAALRDERQRPRERERDRQASLRHPSRAAGAADPIRNRASAPAPRRAYLMDLELRADPAAVGRDVRRRRGTVGSGVLSADGPR